MTNTTGQAIQLAYADHSNATLSQLTRDGQTVYSYNPISPIVLLIPLMPYIVNTAVGGRARLSDVR